MTSHGMMLDRDALQGVFIILCPCRYLFFLYAEEHLVNFREILPPSMFLLRVAYKNRETLRI